jgi:tRNA nucleotidyltransferase (CCA-adding enzyme)
VSPAFAEDPVRILRAARFAARYDFDIAPETGRLMRDMIDAGEVDALTAERVWAELWKALGERQPSRFVRELHDCGALARLFPELAALDGVPQVARHHPEVDTLVHVLMALDQATRLSADPLVRFAVLVHDLGKGVTPSDVLPAHHGHEAAGLPLVEALCARYRAPKACLQLGTIVSAHHLRAHRALELQPKKVVGLFEQIDAFRRPERLDAFLLACEADARGRLGLEDRAYPQALYLRECFAAARSVSAHEVAGPGVTGARIGELVHAARVHTVKDIKTRWQSDPAVMDRMD